MNHKFILTFAVLAVAIVGASCIVMVDANESDAADLEIGVGVYSGQGTVTVYDITTSTMLYNSSATGVHDITIPSGHSFRLTAVPASGYQFYRWVTESGSNVSYDNPITSDTSYIWDNNTLAYFVPQSTTNYTVTISPWPTSSAGSVSTSSVTVPSGTSYSASGNVLTIGSYTITATPASGYHFLQWSTDTGTVSSDRTIRAMFQKDVTYYTVSIGVNPVGSGSVSTSSVSVPEGTSYSASGNVLTIGSYTITATPASGYNFSRWSSSSGTIYSNTGITAYFTAPQPLYIGVGVYSGQGTVTVYDITTSTMLYDSSATGVHEITIPAGHQFKLEAIPAEGYTFVEWREEDGSRTGLENPIISDTSYIWPNDTLAYFSDSGYVVTIVPTPSNGGTVSRERVVVEGPTSYSVNGDTLTIGTTIIRANASIGYTFSFWSPDGGIISADLTIYAHFAGADSTYWYNKNYNGSVSILFDLTGSNTSQTISAAIYSGSVVNSMPIWSITGLTLAVHVDHSGGQAHVGVELLRGTAVVQTNKIGTSWPSIGAWKQIMVTLDTEHGRVNVTPVRTMASFTDYTLYESQTSTAMDFSRHLSGTANATLVLQHDVGAGTPPKFSVTATRPFLDTYGAVMIDPSIDVAHYYPQYDSVRLNFYSFALYGDSITLNGVTWQVDGSKVTIPYVNDRDGKHYTPSLMPGGDVLTKTMELNNIYVSWDHLTGKCSVTFVSDRWTIDLGDYRNKQISFEGMWYFTTMLYEPSITTEKALGEWKTLPETNESQMLLIYLGVLTVAGVAGIIHVRHGGHATLDLIVIAAAGVVGYVMLG